MRHIRSYLYSFLQILRNSSHRSRLKTKKEILRSNETNGIIGAKKNKQESSSKLRNNHLDPFVLDCVGSIRWIKMENLKGKKSNSRVYRKNFISDNEGEFLQLSPPVWFIATLEDLDEERAIVSIEGRRRNTISSSSSSPSSSHSSVHPFLSSSPRWRVVRAREKAIQEKNGDRMKRHHLRGQIGASRTRSYARMQRREKKGGGEINASRREIKKSAKKNLLLFSVDSLLGFYEIDILSRYNDDNFLITIGTFLLISIFPSFG